QVLAPASAHLWLEAVSERVTSTEEISKVAALIEAGPLQPHLRIVVKKHGRSFGRLAARVKEGCIRIWNPDFGAGARPDDIQKAMRLMIDRVVTVRRESGVAHLAIENRPGDDLKHNDLW